MTLLRTGSHAAAVAALLAVTLVPAAPAEEPADQAPEASSEASSPAIATYSGGTVHDAELQSWLRLGREIGDPEDRKAQIEGMLLVRALAATARERGTDREPAIAVALRTEEDEPLARLLRRHASEQVQVSDEEVAEFLRKHPGAFHRPRKVRLRNLFKRFPPGAGAARIEAVRAEMAALEEQLKKGADFAELASRESDSQTRYQGGLIGNAEAGHLRPEIDAVAMALEPGRISPVIETEDGLTLLKCDRIIEARVPTREQAAANVAGNLRRLRARQRWQETEKELLAAAEPRYDTAAPVVLRFAGGQLTRAQLPGLLRSRRRGPDPAAYNPERLREILKQHALRVQSAGRARRLGLGEEPEVRQRIRWQQLLILGAEEMSRRVRSELEPLAAEDIRAYYEAHPERFERLPHFDLAAIRFTLDEEDPRPQHARAEQVSAALRAGSLDFAAAARGHSDHPSAAAGGGLGWQSRLQLAGFGRVVWDTVQGLQPGQVSAPLQWDENLWIFRLNGFQPARPMTFEEAAGAAADRLGTEKAREIEAGLERRLREKLAVRLLP